MPQQFSTKARIEYELIFSMPLKILLDYIVGYGNKFRIR